MQESKYEVKKFRDRIQYYKDGKLHRDNDLPAVEWNSGSKEWIKNGKYHRDNGPACEWKNGDKFWYQNDKRHRLNGPAVEMKNGDKFWYIEGIEYTEKEYNEIISGKE